MTRYIIIILFFLNSLNGLTQSTETVKTEILKLEQMVVQGILRSDTVLLDKLWTPQFMVSTPRNNVAINRASVYDIQRKGLINYDRFEKVVEHVLVEDDIVITMGREVIVSKNDILGAMAGVAVNRRFTNIWKKTPEGWKQIARHASIICN